MKLRELLAIIDPEDTVIVHTGYGLGFRSVVNKVSSRKENAKHLDRQVVFLDHYQSRGDSGYDIILKNKED